MTGSDNLTNQIIQMFNNMSPIRTVITTITRKSVNMEAELDNDTAPSRILDTSGQRLEDYSTVAKAATAIAVALDTKARAAQGAVVQLKSELAQSQQSRTEAKTQVDSLSLIALNPPSDFGADTVVGRIPGRLAGESLDRLGNPTFSMTLQNQEQPIRPDKDQLTADLKMTEEALAEDTAAFEDTTQDCLAIQAKAAEFKNPTKSLSEELEVLAKAKDVISEKTDNSEYRDNRSMLSSHGSLVSSLSKSEHSIELAQLTSHVASALHAEKGEAEESEPPYRTTRSGDIVMVIDGETFCVSEEDMPRVYYEEDDGQVLPTEQVHESMQRELQLMKDLEVSERIIRTDFPSRKKIYSNGDDSSAKVQGLISDMIARLEEKASADATHKD